MRPIFHVAVSHRPSITQINELDPLVLFVELEDDDEMDQETEDADSQRHLPLAQSVVEVGDDDMMDQETEDAYVQRGLALAQPIAEILQREFAKYAPVNKEHPWVKYRLPPLNRVLQ